jgi:transposase
MQTEHDRTRYTPVSRKFPDCSNARARPNPPRSTPPKPTPKPTIPPNRIKNYSREGKRRAIVTLHDLNYCGSKVHEATSIPTSTISDVIKEYEATGDTTDAPRAGRPPKLSAGDKRTLETIIQDEPTLPFKEIADTASQFNIQAFKHTVDKALKETGFSLKVRRWKSYLTIERKEKGVHWCIR